MKNDNFIEVHKTVRGVRIVIATFEVIQYSEKAIALFGDDTFHIRDLLSGMDGLYNERLKYGNDIAKGWIFYHKKKDEVINLLMSGPVVTRFMKTR